MKECPYCGQECVKAECGDGEYRHYCDRCSALEILDKDSIEGIPSREVDLGWRLMKVDIE